MTSASLSSTARPDGATTTLRLTSCHVARHQAHLPPIDDAACIFHTQHQASPRRESARRVLHIRLSTNQGEIDRFGPHFATDTRHKGRLGHGCVPLPLSRRTGLNLVGWIAKFIALLFAFLRCICMHAFFVPHCLLLLSTRLGEHIRLAVCCICCDCLDEHLSFNPCRFGRCHLR